MSVSMFKPRDQQQPRPPEPRLQPAPVHREPWYLRFWPMVGAGMAFGGALALIAYGLGHALAVW
jgi:hypothetical protein